MPVAIIAGDGDKVVFKRRSERLAAEIRGSALQIVEGAGHMVHHLAQRQVARAIEGVSRGVARARARFRWSARGVRTG